MRLPKHCAAALMLALVFSRSGFGDAGDESLVADNPPSEFVSASDYEAATADATLQQQSEIGPGQAEIGEAQPVSYYFVDAPRRVPPVGPQLVGPQPMANYGHLPPAYGPQYLPADYSAQYGRLAAQPYDAGGSEGGCDAGGCDGGCAEDLMCANSWCWQNRIRLFGEGLYLRSGDASVVYAESVTGCDPSDTPTGLAGIAEPNTDLGFRAGFAIPFGGRCCDSGCGGGCDGCSGGHSIVATYSWFESDTSSAINVGQQGYILDSKVTYTGTPSCADGSAAAEAELDLGFQFADVDFRTPLKPICGCFGTVHFLAGLRYCHLDQKFLARQTIGASAGLTDVFTEINFDGVGARFGLEGEMHSNIGLFLYGRGVCNFLGGEFDAFYEQTNQFTTAVIANRFNEYRLISILEAELGVGWVGRNDRFRISAGYQVNSWLNVLNTADYVQGVRNWNVAGQSSNMTFDGLACRLEFRH